MPGLPRGTVTLLFSDVEESTRLVRSLGARYGEALAEHRRLMREAFHARHGVEVDTQGDAFLVAFARARDALEAAADAQRSLGAQSWPGGESLQARIGVHTGEPELTSGDYYVGIDLTRGARICAAAHGGQVLLSQTTRDVVADADVRELGDYELKGLPRPERLYQLVAAGLRRDFPSPRARRVGNLPAPRSELVGRQAEVHAVVELLGRSPLVTLTGSGGVGKTRLALAAARQAAPRFSDGAFFVRLAAVDEPEAVQAAVAQALDVTEAPAETLAETLRRTLRDRDALLVLDSFEHVVAAAPFVAELLANCPRLEILATSRERLHLAEEVEYAVPALTAEEAAALFAARAAAAQPGSVPTDGELELVDAVCRRVDRLPLAIELAAAWLRLLPLPAILERLEQRLSFLVGGARDAPARQQTLAATIDWSYTLLDPEERSALTRLAVFVGGFSLEAAAAVLGDDEAALRLLSSLRDKSLVVTRASSEGAARFAMLDTIREYALLQLGRQGAERNAHALHADYFAGLAERADPELRGPDQAAWLARVAEDHANLVAALVWVRDAGEDATLVRLATGLWRFWFARGYAREGRRWLEEALARRGTVSETQLARTLLGATTLAVADGDLEAARSLGRERLAVCRALGDDADIASALGALANTAAAVGDYDEARGLYEQAAEHAERAEAWPELAATLNNLGYLSLLRGEWRRALAECGEARRRFAELEFREDVAGAGVNVSIALLGEARPEEAVPHILESLSLYARLGHDDGVSYCLDVAAAIAAGRVEDRRRRAILVGAAEDARRRTATTPPPVEASLHERTLTELEAVLGATELAQARAEGAVLSTDEAVTVAEELIRAAVLRPASPA